MLILWVHGMICLCTHMAYAVTPGPVDVPWASPFVVDTDGTNGLSFEITGDESGNVGGNASMSAVSPSGAMYRSLLVPGLGQYANGKHIKALLFFSAEAFFIGGYFYLNHQVSRDDISDYQKDLYRTDRNSYFIYWMLAKIFGMVDAYVDAQLADFNVDDITPPEVEDSLPDTPENLPEQQENLSSPEN